MIDPPGLTRPPELAAELAEAAARLPGPPRSRHLDAAGRPLFVNRLVRAASPYLRQHAHNPVDWWPWGPEALAEAARRGVPVFLSAGYATCHWCHVMEEECFDDLEVAERLNRHFVAIKLDREEHPDIDQMYLTATIWQQGHAGWPNSVFLTPSGAPFATGTYFPKPRFLELLDAIAEGWAARRDEIEAYAAEFAARVMQAGRADPAAGTSTPAPDFEAATASLTASFNRTHGGFGRGPQFPHEIYIRFLLDRFRRSGDRLAASVACASLDAMIRGGLHDHAGGGFHRYTVDANWRTPHFEKMLYNQAQMIAALTEAYAIRPDPAYARAVARTVDYLAREMTSDEGAFFAAEDADSVNAEGRLAEGAFYLWTRDEAAALIGEEAARRLGLHSEPTLPDGAVVHLAPEDPAHGAELDAALETLRQARATRPRPLRDDKIIAQWNGEAIAALARAGRVLGRDDWVAMAARALSACRALLGTGAQMRRSVCAGVAGPAANLADHAALADAALALFEATGEAAHLADAKARTAHAVAAFGQPDGRFALSLDGPLGPILEMEDGAQMSGESTLVWVLGRLARLDPAGPWGGQADACLAALAGLNARVPVARLGALMAHAERHEGPSAPLMAGEAASLRLWIEPQAGHIVIAPAAGFHIDPAASHAEGVTGWPEALAQTPARVGLAEGVEAATLTLQVCDEGACQLPQRFSFRRMPT